jgi:hypothetical protein
MPIFDPTRYIALVKRNTVAATPRYSFSIYTPMQDDPTGMWWTNWVMSTRGNPSTIGCVRVLSAFVAKLCKSVRYSLVFNDPARSAGWTAITPATIADITGVVTLGDAAQNVTYTVVVPANGRIVWEWIGTTVSGRAYVVIKDSLGVEIGLYDIASDGLGNRYVDTYQASFNNDIYRTSLASGLGAGTYTVKITASGVGATKRIYERYCFAIDDSLPGDPTGTDPFVDQLSPSAVIGTGNSEYAARMAQAGSPFADQEYASGVHGYEAGPTGMNLLVNDVDIKATFDLATTYQGTKWSGQTISCSYQTTIRTRVGAVNQATLNWQHLFTTAGYDCNLLRTTLIATDYGQEYVGMIMCPNLAMGGANLFAIAGQTYIVGTVTPPVQIAITPPANNGCTILGSNWKASVRVQAPTDLETRYVHANQSTPKTLIQDRTDGYIKDYRAVIFPISGLTVPVVAGDVCGFQLQYRTSRI